MSRLAFAIPTGRPVALNVTQDGETSGGTCALWKQAHDTLPVQARRVNPLPIPAPGSVAQEDGSHVLDLNGHGGPYLAPFQHEGRVISAHAPVPALQRDGWAAGDYYMLERDGADDLVIEPGRNHRKIHVTAGAHGYTAAAIEAKLGLSSGTVTIEWLVTRPEWGGDETRPLVPSLGQSLWSRLAAMSNATNWQSPRMSIWFLLERGHDYGGFTIQIPNVARGESALHPMLVGAWGTGAKPQGLNVSGAYVLSEFCVFRDLDIGGMNLMRFSHAIADDITTTHEIGADAGAVMTNGITLYRTVIHDVCQPAPVNGTAWEAHTNRITGSYFDQTHGLLMEQALWDHCGWQDGYTASFTPPPAGTPQPPSMFSHNTYVQDQCRDVCMVDSWQVRGASFGIMMRPGGTMMSSLFLDNNAAANNLGGDYDGHGPIGEWGLNLDLVCTSSGYKNIADQIGAFNWGFDMAPLLQSSVDVLVCHRADPDNANEIARKTQPGFALQSKGSPFFDNTLHYRWEQSDSAGGADTALLDRTTIQRHAGAVLGTETATIADYMSHVRGLDAQGRKSALEAVLGYFRTGFGKAGPKRIDAATATFRPDPRGEGFRWDNRLNWSTGDIPGSVAGDRVSLHGNRVKFLRFTTALASASFGGGLLDVSSGKLSIAVHADAARVKVFNSGQYFAPAGAGDYELRDGGRLAFTEATTDVDIAASGNSELLLGPDMTIAAGRTLRLDGARCKAGWDGTGSASLTVEGTLDLRSTPQIALKGAAPRYRAGHPLRGATSGFTGLIDSREIVSNNDWQFRVFLRDMTGTPILNEIATAERAAGIPETTALPAVSGIASQQYVDLGTQMAQIAPFRSGMFGTTAPTVAPQVILGASARLHLNLKRMPVGTWLLIGAPVSGRFASLTIDDLDMALDATVTVGDAGLRLTLAAGSGKVTMN